MTIDVEVGYQPDPYDPITVPTTSVDVTLITGQCTIRGWSLRENSGAANVNFSGTATSPAAGATIATVSITKTATLEWSWTVDLAGTTAAADRNNFGLYHNATLIATSVNNEAVGEYEQAPVILHVGSGDTMSVKAIGAATSGAVYSTNVSGNLTEFAGAAVELRDGNGVLGESFMPYSGTDTQWFTGPGVKVRNQVIAHVVSGTVTGVVYIEHDY